MMDATCLQRLLRGPGAPFAPESVAPTLSSSLPVSSSLPCKQRNCRLRFVVICAQPWGPVPGAGSTPGCVASTGPRNQPPARCQLPITGGAPWCAALAGSPAAIPTYNDIPAAVASTYPTFVTAARTLVFNFGFQNPGHAATGTVLALGSHGKVQASLKFNYAWKLCDTDPAAAFEVVSNKGLSARFTVVNATEFLSTSECTDSTVVLQLQQYCPLPEGASATPVGPGQQLLSQPWVPAGLSSLERVVIAKPCDGADCVCESCPSCG